MREGKAHCPTVRDRQFTRWALPEVRLGAHFQGRQRKKGFENAYLYPHCLKTS